MDIISAIISHSIKERYFIGKNPTLTVKRLKADNKRERILSKNEVIELLICVEENWILNLFTRLSLSTGGRISTILNIKKCDVNLDNEIMTLKDIKTNSTYYGYFSDNILLELVKNRMKMIGDNDYLISNSDYKDMNRYISREMNSIFYILFNHKLASQKDTKNKVVIHTLRHTVLSHLAMNGESVYTIKSISNHKSTAMLERYIKLNPIIGKEPIKNLWN